MGLFNIKVGFGKNEVALTILPAKEYYIVMYFDSIVGAIKLDEHGDLWEQIPEEQIIAGDLPFYKPNLNAERIDFVLCDHTINLIGEEIIAYLKDDNN